MLGQFEQLVLVSVKRYSVNHESYGLKIREHIIEETHQDFLPASVYTTLNRLSRKGLLDSYWSQPVAERGGRRKRIYTVTALGHIALEQMNIMRQYSNG